METVADAAFCNHCGKRLPARCRACDALNPPGSGFCYSCGSPIAAAPPRTLYYEPPPQAAVSCPRCSKTSEPGSAYCYSCGLPFDEPTPRTSAAPPTYARYDSRQARRGDDYGYAVGEPAGFRIRLAAYLIDVVVVIATAFTIGVVFGVVAYMAGYEFEDDGGADLLLFLVGVAIDALYYATGWSRWGTTVGKRIFNMYVARADGSKIGFRRALGRYFGYWVSLLTLGVGFLMIAFSKNKRGLHDLMCDTVVVRRRR